MHKSHALAIAFLITLLIALTVSFGDIQNSRETITIERVIDGDTFKSSDGRTFRLSNINTPEKDTPQARGATEYLSLFIGHAVEVEMLGVDKYARFLVRVYAPEYVNRELVASGLAVKFLVDEEETTSFAAAESEAIAAQRGFWHRSEAAGCVSARIDPIKEKVTLTSTCGKINITHWYVRDESRKKYVFSERSFETSRILLSHTLPPASAGSNMDSRECSRTQACSVLQRGVLDMLVLSTAKGADNETHVFWQSATPIWNNDRDTLYLFDADGDLVIHVSYGYG